MLGGEEDLEDVVAPEEPAALARRAYHPVVYDAEGSRAHAALHFVLVSLYIYLQASLAASGAALYTYFPEEITAGSGGRDSRVRLYVYVGLAAERGGDFTFCLRRCAAIYIYFFFS